MGKKIYVGNLSYNTNESGLTDLFQAHGQIVSVKVITDRDSGRSKGFAFVEMGTEDEARAAITGSLAAEGVKNIKSPSLGEEFELS